MTQRRQQRPLVLRFPADLIVWKGLEAKDSIQRSLVSMSARINSMNNIILTELNLVLFWNMSYR